MKKPESSEPQFEPTSSVQFDRLSQGLRCKQIALLVLLAAPLLALQSWYGQWQPIWLAPLLGVATAILIDLVGRIACWASGFGNRALIISSVVAQVTGLVMATTLALSVPQVGWGLGVIAAVIFQVVAAVTFTNFLADLGRLLGSEQAASQAKRVQFGIFASLASFAGLGASALLVGVLLAMFALLTAGLGVIFALPVTVVILLALSAPLIYFVTSMYWHYSGAISKIRNVLDSRASGGKPSF